MKMIQIKLLKDWKRKKAGDIINISKEGGDAAVVAGVAEYVNKKKTFEIKKYIVRNGKATEIKEPFDFISSSPICVDKSDVEKLEKEFPGAVKLIHKELSRWCEWYNEHPFEEATKQINLESIKKSILLRNLNGAKKEIEREARDWTPEARLEQEGVITYKPIAKDIKSQFLDLLKDKKWGDASELLANWIEECLKIYTTKDDQRSEMWVYKEGVYVPQGKTEIKEMLRGLLGNWYSMWMFNQVLAKVEADTYIEAQQFFENNNPEELPVQNGILNIRTKVLSPFTQDKIFFNKLPVKYNPLALCPQIEQFLKDVLADENDRLVFYEVGGFCLLKEYKFEKAIMLVGNGRNGKDKSLELIKRSIGVENCCSVPLCALVADSFIISEFFGRMANIAGDIGSQDLKDTSEFKSLTGRSLKTAPRKFLKPITFVNYAKFIFACNDLPMVYDTSQGFWDRWVLLEYPFTFATKEEMDNAKDKSKMKLRDEEIIEKITSPDELSGLLNKFLDGFDRLIEKRNFSSTKGSEEIKNIWIRKANSFMAFCLDLIEGDYDKFISKKELRKRYASYCKTHKLTPKTDYVIKRTLEEMFGSVEEFRRTEMGIHDERVWSGITWKPLF